METKRARLTYGLIGGTLCLVAWAATAMPNRPQTIPSTDPPVPTRQPLGAHQVTVPQAPPRVEVVFALDTTGSMTGLIDGAKQKIWSLAQYMASGQPKPELRIGLVAYRDRGDAYVTRFYDLTTDLDDVFEHLQSFAADGGGDGPEDVNSALADAIDRSSWTEGQNTVKIIYLVGDAPPHDDYTDKPNSKTLAHRAKDRGIRINSIRCGSDSTTETAWKRIAMNASGEYASIEQSGGMATIATPYDDKLSALNAKLMGTTIGYGKDAHAVARKVAASLAAPAAMNADRASFYGKSDGAVGGAGDLVKDVAEGRVKADAVPTADLPAAVAAMPAPARTAYVAEKQREREEVQREINKVADERNAFLYKARPKHHASLDSMVESTMRKQAAEAGIKY